LGVYISSLNAAVIPAAAKTISDHATVTSKVFFIHFAPSGFIIDIRRSTGGGIPSVVQFLYTVELYHSLNCYFIEFLKALLTLKSIGCNFPVQLAGMLMT